MQATTTFAGFGESWARLEIAFLPSCGALTGVDRERYRDREREREAKKKEEKRESEREARRERERERERRDIERRESE
jgi:hypothetical protein